MQKKNGIILYDGGLLVLGALILIGLIANAGKNRPKRSAYYAPSYIQTQPAKPYTSPNYFKQQEGYIWKQQKQEENEPSYFEKWQEEEK